MRRGRLTGLAGCATVAGVIIGMMASCRRNTDQKPETTSRHDLISACGIIRYESKQAGTGFFVRAEGARTNTFFVTAAHVIRDLFRHEQNKKGGILLTVWVRQRDGDGPANFELACRPDTLFFIPNTDLAVVKTTDMLLEIGYGVKPIVVLLDKEETSGRPQVETACSRRDVQDMEIGQDVCILTGFPCDPVLFEKGVFPVFYRKGVLSFHKKRENGNQTDMLIIDCPTFNGASGSPVFLEETHDVRARQQRKERHFIGVVTNVLTDKERPGENSGFTGLASAASLVTGLQQLECE